MPCLLGQVLTPAAVRGYDVVWLLDEDVRP
jgi:hypothetical protein